MTRQEIINYLRQTAEQKGITHLQIADALDMKRSSISRLLSNKFPPSMDTVIQITDFLKVTIELRQA